MISNHHLNIAIIIIIIIMVILKSLKNDNMLNVQKCYYKLQQLAFITSVNINHIKTQQMFINVFCFVLCLFVQFTINERKGGSYVVTTNTALCS